MDINFILALGILFGCFLGLSWFAGSDAPYVPTRRERIKKLLKSIPLEGKTFYELGSGDGRVVTEAARMGANAYGIEQSLLRVLYSRLKTSGSNAHFIHGNLFNYNFSNADIVYIFLLPKGVSKLEKKLRKELKKGSVAITQTFHFKNWKPYKKILLSSKDLPNVLLGPKKYEGEFWLYRA